MAFLTFQGITKHFGGVQALSDVSFRVERGSCHALMGENGAGKSTLGKILAGVHTADAGEIRLGGQRVAPADPHAARRLGLAMVHQELAFCPNLTIAENLCLGDLPSRAGVLRRSAMRARAREMLAAIDAPFEVDRSLAELTTGQEQLVQIAAAVGTGARVIVFDEPTSSLSVAESEHLFALLDRLKARGITVLYVSHRMEEIFRLCDAVTVLRDGRHVATGKVAGMTADALVQQMIGRDVTAHEPRHVAQAPGPEALQVEDLTSPGKCAGIGFTLRAGEVLGLAGLVGAGRSEVAHAIFGLDRSARGRVTVRGRPLPRGDVQAALCAGIGFLPEDRKRLGLLLSLNCRENTSLAALARVASAGVIRRGAERSLVQRFIERLRVKTASVEAPVVRLSGGNQQKIALAKWLARECPILIVDEPTRGVDVGAKAEIHRLLDELASAGAAILLISSELPELMALSRRILVLRGGRLVGEVPRPEFSQAGLLRLMAGVSPGSG